MEWKNDFGPVSGKPDKLLSDGGCCAIFRRIACVGDSLSSGEFESLNEEGKKSYHDIYEQSWGQYLARMCGSTVYNFSRGGMTAKEYCERFADSQGFWNPRLAADAYIIALGVNDLYNNASVQSGETAIGTADQTDPVNWRNNPGNFAGYYSTIISRYKEIQPRAKFFLMTMPRETRRSQRCVEIGQEHRDLLYAFAGRDPDIEVIDLWQFAPEYDDEFRKTFFLGGHMNPLGYLFTARLVATCIDWLIRRDPTAYAEIGFIGTEYQHLKYLKTE